MHGCLFKLFQNLYYFIYNLRKHSLHFLQVFKQKYAIYLMNYALY